MIDGIERSLSILLVSNSPAERAGAKAALSKGSSRKYHFTEAALRNEAIGICAHAPVPDCMVLDATLPDGDAIDVLTQLRRDADGLLLLPVVMLTGVSSERGDREWLRAGAHDFVGKAGLDSQTLTRAVEIAVERHALARESNRRSARQQLTAEASHAASGASRLAILGLFRRIGALVDADIQLHYVVEAGEDSPGLRLLACVGLDECEEARFTRLPMGASLWGLAALQGQPVYRHDVQQSTDGATMDLRALGARACVCYPLFCGSLVVETMSFASRTRSEFSLDDLDFLSGMASQVGMAHERLRVDATLRDSEAFNSTLLDSSIDCVKVLDVAGHVQRVNAQGQVLLELDDDSRLIGTAWSGLWPAAAQAQVEAAVRSAALGQAARFEGLCPTLRGTLKCWDVSVSPIRDPHSGEVMRLLVISRDITERHAAVQALRASEKRLSARDHEMRTLTDNAPDIMTRFDRNLRHVFVNAAVTRATGRRPEEFIGKTNRELGMSAELCQQWESALRHVFSTGETRAIDFAFDAPTGTRHYEGRLVAEPGLSGVVEHVLGITHDVTDRRQVEAQREVLLGAERAARSESERVALIKDEFLATLSHELRTPLAAIVGWANVLKRSLDSPDVVQRGVDAIARNGALQARLIDDLLDMNRIVSGKLKLELGLVDIDLVASAAVDTLRPTAVAKGVTLTLSLSQEVLPLVRGDAMRLQQVLSNLLGNAIKFTPNGGSVTIATGALPDGTLHMKVIDTGKGIDPQFLPFLFDRFSQADGTAARVHGGLGLGLSIVKQLVELHGGSVSAASRGFNQGATFTVVLSGIGDPTALAAVPVTTTDDGLQPLPADLAAEDRYGDVDLRGISVLLVDDQDDVLELSRRLIAECGARVVTASSASDAFALLRDERFDLLLSDIGMPGMDGYKLIAEVRTALGLTSELLPAAAISAFPRDQDRTRALQAGYQAYIVKPVQPHLLVRTIAELANPHRSSPAQSSRQGTAVQQTR